jgi:CRP/FNR family cyclic AMP-dependent transcriptional regulator
MNESLLEKIPLFSALDEEALSAVAKHAITRGFPKNTVIINEGDPADSLYVILSGRVKVYLSDEHGKEIIITMLDEGDYFGELALLDDAPRSASVMTLEKSTFYVLSKRDFQECLSKFPETGIKLAMELAHRMRSVTGSVKSLALMDVYGRLARTLLNLASEEVDGKMVVEKKLTHQELANMVGASREMISRILKDLTVGGYITIDKKSIIINSKLPPAW